MKIHCPIPDCTYETEDVEVPVAVALLTIHNNVHVVAAGPAPVTTKHRVPLIDRPKVSKGSNEVTWNAFQTRWSLFKGGGELTAEEKVQHLFQCCDEDLGDDILKAHPQAVSGTEDQLLTIIKCLAVIPVAVSVRRSELISLKQDHGESIRSFYARINGKAATCDYAIGCCSNTCNQRTDFTPVIVKDVLVTGLVSDDIKREVLGWTDLDNKSVEDTVSFIEGKEMARDALANQPIHTAAMSAYKTNNRHFSPLNSSKLTNCRTCKKEMEQFTWSKRQHRMIECTLCLKCWQKANPRKVKNQDPAVKNPIEAAKRPDEASALLFVGAVTSTPGSPSSETLHTDANTTIHAAGIKREIVIDHHIFDSIDGWRRVKSLEHPTLQLKISTDKHDYDHVGAPFPQITPSHVTVVTDTGAQSCLWGLQDFYRCGFKKSDLLPVKRGMVAANSEEIKIEGAILVRLSGYDARGTLYTAPVMAYVSSSTNRFYLSQQSLIQLGIISKNFPQIGAAMESAAVNHRLSPCGCPTRDLPPGKPDMLPFTCLPENNLIMRKWLVERYSASTFNKCPHQQLRGITGPDIRFHIDPDATPTAVHTPATVPLHWQEEVEQQLKDDVALGVLEKVPIGEPSLWCHRMVLARKPDGRPRRTVDLSPLNRY